MYKISNTTTLYSFLFLMLFIGVISNKSAFLAYGLIVAFIVVFTFFKFKTSQISPTILFFCLFGLLILYINLMYQLFYYDHNNLYYIQFFGSQILFFLLFSFLTQINHFVEKYMSKFLLISLVLLATVIIIDYVLIEIGLVSYQLSYTDDTLHAYLSKPLGIFAQFSINSTYAVVFYMLYLYFNKKQKSSSNIILFFLVALVIILQNSGTGYIAYLLLIMTILWKYSLTRYFLIPIIIIASIFIVESNIIQKVSSEYLYFLFEYFYSIIDISYFQNIHGITDVLFGIDAKYNLPIDFGPIFMIGKVGLLYFIFYSLILFYMIYKSSSRYFSMAIFILAFGNLHYPTLFYPIMNILLPILFLHIFNIDKLKYTQINIIDTRS